MSPFDSDWQDIPASPKSEIDKADALRTAQSEQCWILSNSDVWYRNPNYKGPDEPHPDD